MNTHSRPTQLAPILRALASVAILITSLTFSSCSSGPDGPAFSQHGPSSSSKALVYFYRPPGESTGYDRTYSLTVNQRPVVTLLHGGFYPYETAPGTLHLMTDIIMNGKMRMPGMLAEGVLAQSIPEGTLDIQVQAGKTYFVRMHPEKGFFYFKPTLTLMSPEEAAAEIAECNQLSPAGSE